MKLNGARTHHTLVVPANAGTHNHRRLLGEDAVNHCAELAGPRRMGPRVRGDDVEGFAPKSPEASPHPCYCPGSFPTLISIAAKYAARSSMSLSDKDGATTLIASFFRSPDLKACSCVTR